MGERVFICFKFCLFSFFGVGIFVNYVGFFSRGREVRFFFLFSEGCVRLLVIYGKFVFFVCGMSIFFLM